MRGAPSFSDRPPDLIVIGPPGSGKSTLSGRLAEQLGFAHVNLGTLLRQMAAEGSDLARQIRDVIAAGGLVPDALADELIFQRLAAIPPEQGVILDGYPRNAAQARALRRILAESGRLAARPVVLRLETPADELLIRLRRRRDIEGRADDTDDVIRRRLQTYDAEAARIADAVSDWADVVTINGAQPVEALMTEVLEKLEARRGGSSA